MPKVAKPSKNKINQGYTDKHKGYDFDDEPDNKVYASFDGEVITVVDKWDKSWVANTPSDPWYKSGVTRPLTTDDYGNFVKIRGDELLQLTAHLKKGALVGEGQIVKTGDIIGLAGDNNTDTGNSTGGHTHTEYRYLNNHNTFVDWIAEEDVATVPVQQKVFEELVKKSSRYDEFVVLGFIEAKILQQHLQQLAQEEANLQGEKTTLENEVKTLQKQVEAAIKQLEKAEQALVDETNEHRQALTDEIKSHKETNNQLNIQIQRWQDFFSACEKIDDNLIDTKAVLARLASIKPSGNRLSCLLNCLLGRG